MQRTSPAYFAAYQSLKLTRDAQGVLRVEFHTKGGPLTFTAQDHTEFVDAFFRTAQDRASKIMILTGAGGEFIPGIDFLSFGVVADPESARRCRVYNSSEKGKLTRKSWKKFLQPNYLRRQN